MWYYDLRSKPSISSQLWSGLGFWWWMHWSWRLFDAQNILVKLLHLCQTLDLFEKRNGIMIGSAWVQLVLPLPGSKFGENGNLGNLIACVFNHWGTPYPTPSLCFLRYENCQRLSFSNSLSDQSLQKKRSYRLPPRSTTMSLSRIRFQLLRPKPCAKLREWWNWQWGVWIMKSLI